MSRYRGSLILRLFSRWWDDLERSRHLDRRSAISLFPKYFPFSLLDSCRRLEKMLTESHGRISSEFLREHENAWSVAKSDRNKLCVVLDMQQYKPEEIKVKVVDDFVVVLGKHEENSENGIIMRHFTREYMVPKECDPEKITSTLSSDGILTITAPIRGNH